MCPTFVKFAVSACRILLMSTAVNDVTDLVAAWRSSPLISGHRHCLVVPPEALVIVDLSGRTRDGYFDVVLFIPTSFHLVSCQTPRNRSQPPVRTRAHPLGLSVLNAEACQSQPGHRDCIMVRSAGSHMRSPQSGLPMGLPTSSDATRFQDQRPPGP